MLQFWKETDAFNQLRRLRAQTEAQHGIWSFVDGPITANNPMGVHHAWGRTYKDLYNRYHAMLGKNLRWQQGFDCQGLWVEVNAEKELGFHNKRDIEAYGLAKFTNFCKSRVLHYAAKQTDQSVRLGYWMDWNDPDFLHQLRDLVNEDPTQVITVEGPNGYVTDSVEGVIGRLGMAELGGSYFTFSNENNYQIWAFLKECFERGWVYKGRDVMPYCARCGTGISQHEIVTDGYKDVTHESIFLKFPLVGRENEALLVWTTTPWTLSSNVAAAVGPELDYAKVNAPDGWTYYLAEGALKNTLIGKLSDYEVVATLKGAEMVGWEYSAPFDNLPIVRDSFAEADYRHRVIEWKEVGAEEGTGIVHIAPGCGSEDFELSKENDLPVLAPLDENGYFVDDYGWQSGKSVFDVAEGVFDQLRETGTYYRKQKYTHRYPHCWRCHTELVYRLVDEWYINMGKLYDKPREEVTDAEKEASFRYQIMDAVGQAKWFPSFGHDREMDWLRNMHDWMISKKRYYGLALPIYEFEDGSFHVIGSLEELEELAVEGWDEFEGHAPHRPYIDAVKIRHPHKAGLVGTRIKDVGNPWLDAGIVAISTLRYSSDQDYWKKWYPADWISESFPGQFRNWFYSLLAQSTLMAQDAAGNVVGPFKNLFSYGTLYAEDGREMHKSWGNAIWFDDGVEKMGADTMRWLYANCKPEKNLRFGYNVGDETRRRFLIPLWNVYSFFVTYANLDGWQPDVSNKVVSDNEANAQLDAWIVERLKETTVEVRSYLDVYDSQSATISAETLLDDLSNWYVRRSRRRFWRGEMDADKQAAYETLYFVLLQFAKLLAPFVPFVTETIYQNLAFGENGRDQSLTEQLLPASVHHCLYPSYNADTLDRDLLDKMRLAITAASLGRAARGSADIKLRQPLAQARINVGTQAARNHLEALAEVLQEELNVKLVEVVSDVGDLVDYKIMPNNRLLGPKFGKRFGAVRKALSALSAAEVAQTLQSDGELALDVGGEQVVLSAEEIIVNTEAKGDLAVASDKGVTVAVDTHLSAELVQEGYARDLVRNINNARKKAGFAISDRIDLAIVATGDVAAAVTNFVDYIQGETLANSIVTETQDWFTTTAKVGGQTVEIDLRQV